MAKAKTSQKRKNLLANTNFDDLPIVSLKNPSEAASHSPGKALRSTSFVAQALFESLLAGDDTAFKEIIRAHYEAVNVTRTLKRAKLSKRTFYQAVSPEGNPSLKTISKMLHGLKMAA